MPSNASSAPARFAGPPLARAVALRAGALAMLRAINRRRSHVIAYHRFPASSVETLRRQCDYLRRRHRPVSLHDVVRSVDEGMPLPPGAVAVTVDDGYRDFYEHAYPVFRDYGIPVTVFLTSGFLDRSCWLWRDVVEYLLFTSPLKAVEIPIASELPRFSLDSRAQRIAAVIRLNELLKRLDNDARNSFVYDTAPALLKASAPAIPPVEYAALTWDEVREMRANGMSFGSHTQTHPILASIRAEARVSAELTGAKRRIEAEIGQPVHHFAYPNGTRRDINDIVVTLVKRAGYRAAFLAEPGPNLVNADAFTLLRNVVEPATPLPFFGRNVLR